MAFALFIKSSAAKESENIPKATKDRIRQAISGLMQDPLPRGVKKLQGRIDVYRIRIGDYRVLYEINHHDKKVVVLSVLHRKEAYR